jgi:hypothetical protein
MVEKLNAIQNALDALDRLQDDENTDVQERKFQLATLKERFRLLKLYEIETEESEANAAESEELAEIRQYLEPLGLAAPGTPLPELARLAALRITQL